MVDLTRAEVEKIAGETAMIARVANLSVSSCQTMDEASQAITQLLAQLDAAKTRADAVEAKITESDRARKVCMGEFDKKCKQVNKAVARADAAAGQMRERCAQEVQMFIEGFAFDEEWQLADLQSAIRALPLHEEPNNDVPRMVSSATARN